MSSEDIFNEELAAELLWMVNLMTRSVEEVQARFDRTKSQAIAAIEKMEEKAKEGPLEKTPENWLLGLKIKMYAFECAVITAELEARKAAANIAVAQDLDLVKMLMG